MSYPPLISLNLDVREALKQVEDITKQLSEKELEKATARTINRTLLHVRSEIVKQIPKVYAIKGFQVRDRFNILRAGTHLNTKSGSFAKNYLTGLIMGVSNRISISNFENKLVKGGVTTKLTRSKKQGLGVKTGKGRGPDNLFVKIYKKKSAEKITGAFLIERGSSRFFAFRGKYHKINEYRQAEFDGRRVQNLLTQSVWDMSLNKAVQLPTGIDAVAFFINRFKSEAEYLISKQTI